MLGSSIIINQYEEEIQELKDQHTVEKDVLLKEIQSLKKQIELLQNTIKHLQYEASERYGIY